MEEEMILTAKSQQVCARALVLLLWLMASAQAQDLSAVKGIDGKEALFHVKFLASAELRGREAFTSDERIAGRYIANEFERYGLKAIDSGRTYFQEIDAKHISVSAPGLLALGGHAFTEGKDYRIAAVGSNDLDARVVFVGYGVTVAEYDSYAGVDAKGKIVMVFEGNFRGKGGSGASLPALLIGNAINHGATGMIFVRGTSPRNRKWEIESELSLASLTFPIAAASRRGICHWSDEVWSQWSKFPLAYVSIDVANGLLGKAATTITALKKEADDKGKPNSFVLGQRLKMQASVQISTRRTRNVIGFLEGRDPSVRDQVIVIGAHYDHVGVTKDTIVAYGADDNASGTAALLEIAQAFTECNLKPRRSVLLIAFTGEEKGLIGSQYYVDHPLVPLSKTKAFINLDMVGRNDPCTIKMDSRGISESLTAITEQSAKDAGMKMEDWDDPTGSDQGAFFMKDVPFLWFFDGGGDFAHGPADSWDKIAAEKLEKVARLCFLTVYRIADGE
jgi:hypothetical protein